MYPTRAQVKTRFWSLLDDPAGQIFVDGASTTGNVTSGSATINSLASTVGIVAGQLVAGAGIPAQTTVLMVTGFSVVVSQNATANGTAVPLTFSGPSVFQDAFGEAFDALYNAFLNAQCPRIELLLNVTVPYMTTAMTPAQMGIVDWGDYIYLSERRFGSQDEYIDLVSVDRLTQRAPYDRLGEFNFRNDTFYFIGATNTIDLQVKYDASAEAPTSDSTQIMVDSSLTFLANYAAGVAGVRKGYTATAQRCMSLAVGPKYDQGTIGGALFRLVQPLVRSRQKVQIAPKPYSATRRFLIRFPIPYVAAQQGTTGGGATNVPVEYSSVDGSIVGAIDGTNLVFWVNTGCVTGMELYRNGVLQTFGVDYTYLNNQITFFVASVPQTGDILTAEVTIGM